MMTVGVYDSSLQVHLHSSDDAAQLSKGLCYNDVLSIIIIIINIIIIIITLCSNWRDYKFQTGFILTRLTDTPECYFHQSYYYLIDRNTTNFNKTRKIFS